jgi:hypothetical protein
VLAVAHEVSTSTARIPGSLFDAIAEACRGFITVRKSRQSISRDNLTECNSSRVIGPPRLRLTLDIQAPAFSGTDSRLQVAHGIATTMNHLHQVTGDR